MIMARPVEQVLAIEYIQSVLYFATVRTGKELKSTENTHYFSIDDELCYENYYSDFGPLNISCVYKYCKRLDDKIRSFLNKKKIIHYTSTDQKKKANAAYLLGCYGVLYLSYDPKDALKPLLMHGQSYRPFQDATQGDSPYTITLLDCLNGIRKASDLGFFNFQDFDDEEYDRLSRIESVDLNWIVPGKFVAFIGPVDKGVSFYHPPKKYVNYFMNNNVQAVIRLNKRLYDSSVFTNAGIVHYDLYFPDGSCPPRNILLKFLQISEDTEGALGVHCKAGLGRTGSLIGAYLIKHYRMTSHEAIAWMRICRPGSVIGHQQAWLEELEPWLLKQGNIYRKRFFQDIEKIPTHEHGIYSIAEKSLRVRPEIFKKAPSPPPPMQRELSSEIGHLRVKTSKNRDVVHLSPSEDQADRHVRTNMDATLQTQHSPVSIRPIVPTNMNNNSRRGSGEPRSSRMCSREGSAKSTSSKTKSGLQTKYNNPQYRNATFQTMPSLQSNPMAILKNVNDAKKYLMSSSKCTKSPSSNISKCMTPLIYPQCERLEIKNIIRPKPELTAPQKQVPPSLSQFRRRLGRSPSPQPIRTVFEHSRATNTPPASAGKRLNSKASKISTNCEVLKINITGPPRDAASVGAASLGARRTAPAPLLRAPSVRSDERPTATQGDMLNSIKFQRRMFDIVQADRYNAAANVLNQTPTRPPYERLASNTNRSYSPVRHVTSRLKSPQAPAPSSYQKDTSPSPQFRSPLRPSTSRGRRYQPNS